MYAPLFFMEIVNTRGRVKKAKSVSAYIAAAPPAVRSRLRQLRQVIKLRAQGRRAHQLRDGVLRVRRLGI